MKCYSVILFLGISMISSCANNKEYFENTYNSEYRGQISKIYKDEMSHNSTYFEFKLCNGKLSNIIADAFPGSIDYACVGDSIIKYYGNVDVIIKKKDRVEKKFSLNYR